MSQPRRDPSTTTGNPTNGGATNGDAPQAGLEVGPYGNGLRQSSNKELCSDSNNNPVIFPPTLGPDPKPIDGPDTSSSVAAPDLSDSSAQWIWTNEQPFNCPPGGPRAFRKAAILPSGKQVDSMTIDITCDNFYTLYVNGYLVGNGKDWTHAQRFSIKFPRTNKVLIAVYAANDPILLKCAGVIAAAVMWDSTDYDGMSFNIYTDSTWKCSVTAAKSGFEKINYRPDGSWGPARLEGPLVTPPWTAPLPNVIKPTSTDALNGAFSGIPGVSNPPSAPDATPGPDTSGNTTF